MNTSLKHNTEKNKVDTEEHTLWLHLYKFQKQAKLIYGVKMQNNSYLEGE